jgi:hypothetical protein
MGSPPILQSCGFTVGCVLRQLIPTRQAVVMQRAVGGVARRSSSLRTPWLGRNFSDRARTPIKNFNTVNTKWEKKVTVTAYFSTTLSAGASSSLARLTGEIERARFFPFLPFNRLGGGAPSSGDGARMVSDSYSILTGNVRARSLLGLLQGGDV